VFHVYDMARLEEVPARYTVAAGGALPHPLPAGAADLFVLGPDGFHRRLLGRGDLFGAALFHARAPMLMIENFTDAALSVPMTDRAYGAATVTFELRPRETRRVALDLAASHGWYDRQLVAGAQAWRIAGHSGQGGETFSDPAMGGPGPLMLEALV
jgi:phospholipase C